MEQLDPGAKWFFRVRFYFSFFFWVFFLSAFFGWFVLVGVLIHSGGVMVMFFVFSALGYIVLTVVLGEVYARLAYKNFKYELNPREIKIEKGVIFKVYKSIPYERIQNIDLYRGIIARMFGFTSVNIQTAGYSMGYNRRGSGAEGSLPAVSQKDAEKIREFLMKKIGRRSGI